MMPAATASTVPAVDAASGWASAVDPFAAMAAEGNASGEQDEPTAQQIDQVTGVTQCSEDKAKQALLECGGDVEAAIFSCLEG